MQLNEPSETAKGPEANFTGDVYVNPLQQPKEPSKLTASLVRFTPGAHTNWHSHAVGQTLHCVDGQGLVVSRDGTVIRIRQGDTVWTPPGEEHWHGATDSTMMAHIALFELGDDGAGTKWLEPVSEQDYGSAHEH